MDKILFSKKKGKETLTDIEHGECVLLNSGKNKVIVYTNADNKMVTLIHELIHSYLFKLSNKGYQKKFIDRINNNEVLVDGIAEHIFKGFNSINEENLAKCLNDLKKCKGVTNE